MNALVFFALLSFVLFAQSAKLSETAHPSVSIRRRAAGAVYVMSNNLDANTILAYTRLSNGTLLPMGTFATGGKGAILDDFDDVDPLFSAHSLIVTPDYRYILNVNAGSRSVTVFKVLRNFSLLRTSVATVSGFGPLSVAYSNGLVYVASVEASSDPADFSILGAKGALTGFRLSRNGKLFRLEGSVRRLTNRPGAVQFSLDGRSLVVSSFNAGSEMLDSDEVDELVVYTVRRNGLLSSKPVSTATSTELNDPRGRNLPGAIGFDMALVNGVQYVIVGEARVFTPVGAMTDFQTSSVSIWKLSSTGQLIPSQLDVLVGNSFTEGALATCWVEVSKNQKAFWVSNTITGTVSAFSFKNGKAKLADIAAGDAPIPIDLWRSKDGKFLYQLSNEVIEGFRIDNKGFGTGLTPIQSTMGLPEINVQGIVAI